MFWFKQLNIYPKLGIWGGIPVPTKIILVDINKDYCYVYDATKYKNLIENKYTDSASKNNDKLTVKDSTAPEAEFKHVDKYLLDKDKQKEVEKEEQKQDKQKEKEKRKGKMVWPIKKKVQKW